MPGKKESTSRTPPEKRKTKVPEQDSPPVPNELSESSTSSVLKGEDIQALTIKLADLEKLHLPRRPTEDQKSPVTNRVLLRRSHDKDRSRKRRLLVARPAPEDSTSREQPFSAELHLGDTHGQLQPHSILGSLQELSREAATRGNAQIAQLIPDQSQADFPSLGAQDGTERLQQKELSRHHRKQDNALLNWQYHMTLRKRQLDALSRRLCKPSEQLVMNTCEDYRGIQEDRHAIDRCVPSLESGKGYRVGSEFWNVSERIGDELSGLMMTLTQCERGYPSPITHIGKTTTIKQETGFLERPLCHDTWDKSLYLRQRRHELRAVMEELNFSKLDIDGLEVIGRGRPFTSISAKHFPLIDEEHQDPPAEEKENMDPLQDYPDVIADCVLGPSLLFCGQPAAWVADLTSHRDKVGITTRITFEALAGEKASSALEVVNNGSAAIWYEWRRLPNTSSLGERLKGPRVQHFYFNTSAGVILPGETQTFPFHFKSPTAGIFGESWELCTHPVLLAGALIQVSLWGIALYEDKTAPLREALERELESREALFIAQKIVQEIMDCVRSPERPQSPATRVTQEEIFSLINPKLHYKHQTVQELHQLWREYIYPGTQDDAGLSEEGADHVTLSDPRPEQCDILSEMEDGTEWNMSVVDLKQASCMIPEEERRETFLLQVNRLVYELSTPAPEVPIDRLQQACLQLWREATDKMAERSTELRFILGMPDKDVTAEVIPEEAVVDQKRGKPGKEEKKPGGTKDDKRTPVGKEKEEKKGGKLGVKEKLEKEDRPSSRKLKGKDENKSTRSMALLKESKELLSSSGESLELSRPQSSLCQVDPAIQEKYQDCLYTELYGILASVVENLVDIAEDLKSTTNPSWNPDSQGNLRHTFS